MITVLYISMMTPEQRVWWFATVAIGTGLTIWFVVPRSRIRTAMLVAGATAFLLTVGDYLNRERYGSVVLSQLAWVGYLLWVMAVGHWSLVELRRSGYGTWWWRSLVWAIVLLILLGIVVAEGGPMTNFEYRQRVYSTP